MPAERADGGVCGSRSELAETRKRERCEGSERGRPGAVWTEAIAGELWAGGNVGMAGKPGGCVRRCRQQRWSASGGSVQGWYGVVCSAEQSAGVVQVFVCCRSGFLLLTESAPGEDPRHATHSN